MDIQLHRRLYALSALLAVLLAAWLIPQPWGAPLAALIAGGMMLLGGGRWPRKRAGGAGEDYVELLSHIGEGDLRVTPERLTAGNAKALNSAQHMLFGLRRMVGSVRALSLGFDSATSRLESAASGLLTDAQAQNQAVAEAGDALQDAERSTGQVESALDSLRRAGERNAAAVVEMQSSIEEVSSGVGELVEAVAKTTELSKVATTSAAQVARSAELLTSSATQNAAAMMEMDATIQQVSQLTRDTGRVADQAVNAAESGKTALENTLSALRGIEQAVGESAAAVRALGERGAQIGSIVSVIKEIADQTGLLALNASILAAQAGEHGRGFSVVAEEIRELSERTAGSTREISQLIGGIRGAVDDARSRMEVGITRAREGVEVGRNAAGAFSEITGLVVRSREATGAISRAMDEQARGSREVAQAIELMSQQIGRISEEAQQQAQVARELTNEADQINERGQLFRQAMASQAAGTAQISQVTEQLSLSIESIGAAMTAITAAVGELSSISSRLRVTASANANGAQLVAATAGNLNHEARFLQEDLARFRTPEPKSGGTLRIAIFEPTTTIDVTSVQTVRGHEMGCLTAEGLLGFGTGISLRPLLAERYDLSSDGLLYTFHLRAGLRFSDGQPLSAEDVIASFLRTAHPKNENPCSWVFDPVVGIEDYAAGRAATITGIDAPDSRTVRIRIKYPLPFFPFYTTIPATYIIPASQARAIPGQSDRPLTGTGPFRITERRADRLMMERNPFYHRPGEPRVDRLEVYTDLKPEDQIAAFRAGQLDALTDVQRQFRNGLLADPQMRPLIAMPGTMNTVFITLRCDKAPFTDPRVRRAVHHAIDRPRLVKAIHGDRCEVATGFLPPGMLGHDPAREGCRFDPDRTRELLRETGFGGGLTLDLHATASQGWDKDAERALVREMLANAGITLRIEEVSTEESRRRLKAEGRSLLTWSGWNADFPDPDNFFYVVLHSSQSAVVGSNYKNSKFDELSVRARHELSLDKRAAYYRQLEEIIAEDPPIIPLYHDRSFVMHAANIGGGIAHATTPVLRMELLWRES